MIKILVISSKLPPEYSGSGNRIFETYERLKKKHKINSAFLTSSVIKNHSHEYSFKKKKIYCISKKIIKKDFFEFDLISKILNFIVFRLNYVFEAFLTFLFLLRKAKKFDLIHIIGNNNVTNSSITFCKIFKIPNIIEIVNDTNNTNYYEPSLIKLFYGEGYPVKSIIIAISKKVFKIIKKKKLKNKIIYKPNPVKPNFKNTKIKKAIFFRKKIKILHLAKFIPRKKQDFLVNVLKYLPNKYVLILAGPYEKKGIYKIRDKNYLINIKKQIRTFKLEKRVKIITKFIKDPSSFIAGCNIFALPSINEGLGTTILEAATLKKPIICNKLKGVFDEWVVDGKNGYLCKLNETDWAKKITLMNKLKKKNLLEMSREIYNKSNVDVIDNYYFECFRFISKKKINKKLT